MPQVVEQITSVLLVVQHQVLLNSRWVIVIGSDVEYVKKLIASDMLGSA